MPARPCPEQLVEGAGEPGEIGFARQAVVAFFDQSNGDVAAMEARREG